MKAIVIHNFGGIDELQLEEVPIPKPGPGQVLVHVREAGVGPWDALVRTGQSGMPQPLPLTPGSDIGGVVEGTGEEIYGVTSFVHRRLCRVRARVEGFYCGKAVVAQFRRGRLGAGRRRYRVADALRSRKDRARTERARAGSG